MATKSEIGRYNDVIGCDQAVIRPVITVIKNLRLNGVKLVPAMVCENQAQLKGVIAHFPGSGGGCGRRFLGTIGSVGHV